MAHERQSEGFCDCAHQRRSGDCKPKSCKSTAILRVDNETTLFAHSDILVSGSITTRGLEVEVEGMVDICILTSVKDPQPGEYLLRGVDQDTR